MALIFSHFQGWTLFFLTTKNIKVLSQRSLHNSSAVFARWKGRKIIACLNLRRYRAGSFSWTLLQGKCTFTPSKERVHSANPSQIFYIPLPFEEIFEESVTKKNPRQMDDLRCVGLHIEKGLYCFWFCASTLNLTPCWVRVSMKILICWHGDFSFIFNIKLSLFRIFVVVDG